MKRTIVFVLMLTACSLTKTSSLTPDTVTKNARLREAELICSHVLRKIDGQYYNPTDVKTWVVKTLNRGIFELDKHGWVRQIDNSEDAEKESWYGFGITISESRVLVYSIMPGSPAWHADFHIHDEVLSINNFAIQKLELRDVLRIMDATDSLDIALLRKGQVVRKHLLKAPVKPLPPIATLRLAGNAGYLRLDNFEMGTGEFAGKALISLGQIDRLVVDLRSNPGGDMYTTVYILSFFFKPHTKLLQSSLVGLVTDITYESADIKDFVFPVDLTRIPLVVLINRETASMAEFFALAMKERGRAVIIGETTKGLGTILNGENLQMKEGKIGFRIPTEEYFGEKSGKINHIGVPPDMYVQETNPVHRYYPEVEDSILERALLVLKSGHVSARDTSR